jgi:protein-S-isoprenylcysteine O-methyltransferase Ste14
MMNTPKIFPPTYTLIALLAMVTLHFVLPVGRILLAPWVLLGILPMVLGIALNIQADNLFHQLGTPIKPGAESSLLVTRGPFRWSRNPMYLGFVLILLGVAILLGSITPFLVVPVFAILIERNFIRMEEGMLAGKFGPSWQEYRQKTRRWI